MKLIKWLLAAALMLTPSLGVAQSYYTDRAVGVSQFNGFSGLVPISYGQVRACNLPLTQQQPCLPLAVAYDATTGANLFVNGGNFGQVTTDIVGRFNIRLAAGDYQIQVAATGSNTPQLNYRVSVGFNGTNFEGTRYADQYPTLQAAINDLGGTAGKVYIPCGTYNTSAAITASFDGLIVEGAGSKCVKIVYTGTATIPALFDLGDATNNRFDNAVSGFSLYGNGAAVLNATNGIRVRGVHHSQFSDIRIHDVVDCGLLTNFAVVDSFDYIRVSNNDENFIRAPQRGLCFDQRGVGERTTAGTVTNGETASTTVAGADLISADNMTFTGGEYQFTPIGIIVGRAADPTATWGNTFTGVDLEANTVEDMQVNGFDTRIENAISTGNTGVVQGIHIKATAVRTTIANGNFYGNPSIKIDAGALYTKLDNPRLQTAISDAGTGTTRDTDGIVSANSTIPGSAAPGDFVCARLPALCILWTGTDGNGFIERFGANGMLFRAGSGSANLFAFDDNTASHPALKTNGTTLRVRLGDDSADAPFTAGAITSSAANTGNTLVGTVSVTAPIHAINANITWSSGAGIPSAGSCTVAKGGSLYSRTDGTTTTSLYVCDNATGVWTAK